MKKYELIVSDLDGTLLGSDMQLSEKNRDAIEKLCEMGIKFVPSSGRTFYEIPSSVRENPNIRYIVYSNGTAIYDKEAGCDIVSNRISKDTVTEALDILSDYDVFLSTHSDGHALVDVKIVDKDYAHYQINDYYKSLFMKASKTDGINAFTRTSDAVEALVIFFHSDRELVMCQKRLQKIDGITVTSSIGHNIELCSAKAGKGEALAALAKILEIPKEKIIAVGDNMNDVSMFTECGLSLCTKNGNEEAKKLADRVICSNNDGIADYVLNYIID